MKTNLEKTDTKVEMVDTGEPSRTYTQHINTFGTLGRELKVSPKSCITINKPGYKTEFFVESVSILIGIGKDHTADIIMSRDSWDAFVNGAEISITTLKEFKKKFL